MSRAFRLSDSSLKLLHTCERLYQLDRLLLGGAEKKHYPPTVLGTAYGAGVATYMQTQDIDTALYSCWLNYFPRVEDDKRKQTVAANLLIASVPAMDNLLAEWELVFFNGKPAIELSFRLNIDGKYYFVGKLDFVLRNRFSKKYAVFDAKTTAMNLLDLSPLYQNLPQLIGYSISLDTIVGEELAEYDVTYFVAKLGSGTGFQPEIKPYTYTKTLQDRLSWLISLGLDVKHLNNLAELNFYPTRGDNCLQYNKPCKHFGVCTLRGLDREQTEEEDTTVYDFTFSLDDVITNHLQRIAECEI